MNCFAINMLQKGEDIKLSDPRYTEIQWIAKYKHYIYIYVTR